MNNKTLTLLGFCRKAGRLTVGSAKTTELLKDKKVCLVVVAEDVSQKTEKELKYFAEKNSCGRVIRLTVNTDVLSKAIGIKAGVVATCDEGFMKAILEEEITYGD